MTPDDQEQRLQELVTPIFDELWDQEAGLPDYVLLTRNGSSDVNAKGGWHARKVTQAFNVVLPEGWADVAQSQPTEPESSGSSAS